MILEQLISKESVISVIANFTTSSNRHLCIKDSDGNVLLGSNGHDSDGKYPILMDSKAIGWVIGGKKASAAALFLTHIAAEESENKTVMTNTFENSKRLGFLSNICEKMSDSYMDPVEISRMAIKEAKKIMVGSDVSVILGNSKTSYYEIINESGEVYHLTDIGDGIVRNVMLTGTEEIVNDAGAANHTGNNSFIVCMPLKTNSLPLKANNRIMGVIRVSRKKYVSLLPYTSADLRILKIIASHASLSLENAKLYNDSKDSFITIIDTLFEILEKRDTYTAGHTRRVKNYCMFLGRMMGLSDTEMRRLHLAAILHDIGKIGVKDQILRKTGKLTEEEYGEMKKHASYGWEMLRHIKIMEDVLPGVRHHHERYDGNGYPDRLMAEEIDIIARIIAVADAFDAMTFDRPYKSAMTIPEAFEELKKNSGDQFDPAIVTTFAKTYENGSFSHTEIMLCFKRDWNFSFSELA